MPVIRGQLDMLTPQEIFLLRLSVERVRSSVEQLLDDLRMLTDPDLEAKLPYQGDRAEDEDELPF